MVDSIAALISTDERIETALAIPFGVGIGLTFDEAALLLELEDVYWTPEGLLSVQISLGVSAVLGATIIALRMLRRGEEEAEEAGRDPDAVEVTVNRLRTAVGRPELVRTVVRRGNRLAVEPAGVPTRST